MPAAGSRRYAFEGFCLDTQTRELRAADGRPVALNPKAFDTLCYLIAHRDRVVGKDELLAAVWPGRVIEENNLSQAISALRRALGSPAGEHRFVVTVPRQGYRFVADLDEGAEVTAERQPAPAPAASGWRGRRVHWAFAAVALLLAAVAWQVQEAAPPPQQRLALAVLPFQALPPGPDDGPLGIGLAETLITRLGGSGRLRVRSLAAAEALAVAGADPLAIGRQLGATHVIEGSTQRIDDRLRVNARLRAVDDGNTLWTEVFDTRVERAFTLQDELAANVLAALGLPPVASDAARRSACDGEDPVAYRAWLRGHHLLQRPNEANLEQALVAFRQAIDLDTACTRAYAGLSLAYRGLVHTDRDPREMFPLAKAAAAQALRLDPDSAVALTAHGRVQHLYEWDWEAAEDSFRRAIVLNPSLMEARFAYAHLLVDLGRFDEGLEQARQARELDPLSPMINALEAGFLTAAGQSEAAQVQIERALALQPEFWIGRLIRGGMALDRGDHAVALADLALAVERSHRTSQTLAVLAAAQAAAGDRPAAEALWRELDGRDAEGYVPATSLAAVRLALGDRRGALDLLDRGYRERDIRMAFLKVDARWNPLRGEPRFEALAERMRLSGGSAQGRY